MFWSLSETSIAWNHALTATDGCPYRQFEFVLGGLRDAFFRHEIDISLG
ncbi:MAG: hypothetical protein ACR2OA_06715 [Rubripirellula sp.]|jgi:hypothetical protein